jgi:hypothetical protein
MNNRCAKCGSDKVVPLASIAAQSQQSQGQVNAYIFSNPEAWIFKGPVFARLRARICGECGHAELIAENAAELYEAYRQAAGQEQTEA